MAKRPTLSMYTDMGPADFRKMSEPELKMALRVMSDVANKRAKRLMEGELEGSPALSAAGSPHFGIKGKTTKDALLQEAARVSHFLGAESSTVSGRKSQIKAISSRFSSVTGLGDLTGKQQTRFWNAYQKWADKHPNEVFSMGSQEAVKMFAQARSEWQHMASTEKKGQKMDDFLTERINQLNEEQQTEGYIDVFDESDYVEIQYKQSPRNTRKNTTRKNKTKKKN